MEILSIRKDFSSDHSSTHTEYIGEFEITCDYDWWYCKFSVPYEEKLYKEIKKYQANGDYNLDIERVGDEIEITIDVHLDYGAMESRNPYIEYYNYCKDIRDNILDGDYSDLELLKAYVELSVAEYNKGDHYSSSGIEFILEKNC